MRHGKSTIVEATKLIEAMRKAGVPAFQPEVFGLADRELIQDMINKAKRHCSTQEKWCSDDMSEDNRKRLQSVEAGLEIDIRMIAQKFGLTVRFDGDPRGFTVKLHAPKGEVFNTWGGKESGYGIGESE